MRRFFISALLVMTLVPLYAAPRRVSNIQTSTYWACLHFATWTEAQAQLAYDGGASALVYTGDVEWPYVVVQKWNCGSCAMYPGPVFAAEPQPVGSVIVVGGKAKPVAMPDGTVLLVGRI